MDLKTKLTRVLCRYISGQAALDRKLLRWHRCMKEAEKALNGGKRKH